MLDININYEYLGAGGKVRSETGVPGPQFSCFPPSITKELGNRPKLCLLGRCRRVGAQPCLLVGFLSLWPVSF